jgi:hypothetical protein
MSSRRLITTRQGSCIHVRVLRFRKQVRSLLADPSAAHRLAHIDDKFLVAKKDKTATDCELTQGSEVYYNLWNQDAYCDISFPFSKADVTLKDPALMEKAQLTFGLIPLQLDKLYKSLREFDGLKFVFIGGDSVHDIASDTRWLFSLVTPLSMSNNTVWELKNEDEDRLQAILHSSSESPLFLVLDEKILIVRKPVEDIGNQWEAFDVALGPVKGLVSFDTSELEKSPETTYLIYFTGLAPIELPADGIPDRCNHSTTPSWSDGKTKVWPWKS